MISKNGNAVIIEDEPIEVARVPVYSTNVDKTPYHRSVFVRPDYVPEGVPHEVIKVEGLIRGRTLDIKLKNPFTFEGVEYTILNFKGVGAEHHDEEMIINPAKWYSDNSTQQLPGLPLRMWGGVGKTEGKNDFYDQIFAGYGIPEITHVALHDMPSEITSNIRRIYGSSRSRRPLCQIVRASNTNVRMSDVIKEKDFYNLREHVDPEKLASIDADVIEMQKRLARNGEMVMTAGHISENRLIDGTFVDSENYGQIDFNFFDAAYLLYAVIASSHDALPKKKRRVYQEALEDKTKMNFTRTKWDEHELQVLFRLSFKK